MSWSIWLNMRRQPPGEMKGSKPSTTSTRASAVQNVLPSMWGAIRECGKLHPWPAKSPDATPAAMTGLTYFAGAADGAPCPRKTRKNSEPFGSKTITSLLLEKLAL